MWRCYSNSETEWHRSINSMPSFPRIISNFFWKWQKGAWTSSSIITEVLQPRLQLPGPQGKKRTREFRGLSGRTVGWHLGETRHSWYQWHDNFQHNQALLGILAERDLADHLCLTMSSSSTKKNQGPEKFQAFCGSATLFKLNSSALSPS